MVQDRIFLVRCCPDAVIPDVFVADAAVLTGAWRLDLKDSRTLSALTGRCPSAPAAGSAASRPRSLPQRPGSQSSAAGSAPLRSGSRWPRPGRQSAELGLAHRDLGLRDADLVDDEGIAAADSLVGRRLCAIPWFEGELAEARKCESGMRGTPPQSGRWHTARHSFDLVIVGSGPAGLAAAAQAAATGLPYVVLERTDHLSDTIHCYQKRKHVMAEPGMIPQRGGVPFFAGSRESILDAWGRFAGEQRLNVYFRREMVGLEKAGEGFLVRTAGDEYEAAKDVLAIGTQGNPRRLGAPGDDLPHVSTRLVDPDEFHDLDILVVGAGDSALEVAIALAPHNRVGLVVRTPEILKAKESLEREALGLQARGQMKIHFSSTVARVEPEFAELKTPEGLVKVPARQIILKLG